MERFNLSKKPRQLLLADIKGERIVVSSNLLRLYPKKGLTVTKISHIFEIIPVGCFTDFVTKVCQARRAGDVYSDQSIIAVIMKLISNSACGSLIMNKDKHWTVKYVCGMGVAQQKICSPMFCNGNKICYVLYEIVLSKQKIVKDIQMQIVFQILQLAKLGVFEFYYNCMNYDCNRSAFECVDTEKDSLHAGITGKSFQNIMKPERLHKVSQTLKDYCSSANLSSRVLTIFFSLMLWKSWNIQPFVACLN